MKSIDGCIKIYFLPKRTNINIFAKFQYIYTFRGFSILISKLINLNKHLEYSGVTRLKSCVLSVL